MKTTLRTLALFLCLAVGFQPARAEVVFVPPLSGGSAAALATYTPSAAASVDITSVITSACYKHRIEFDLLPATDDVELWVRTDDANGASFDAGATDYRYAQTQTNDAGGNVLHVSTGTTAVKIGEDSAGAAVGNAANEGISGSILVERVGSGTLHPLLTFEATLYTANGAVARQHGSASRAAAVAINAAQLLFESGNIASGTVKVHCIPN